MLNLSDLPLGLVQWFGFRCNVINNITYAPKVGLGCLSSFWSPKPKPNCGLNFRFKVSRRRCMCLSLKPQVSRPKPRYLIQAQLRLNLGHLGFNHMAYLNAMSFNLGDQCLNATWPSLSGQCLNAMWPMFKCHVVQLGWHLINQIYV